MTRRADDDDLSVTGTGCVTPLGSGVAALYDGWLAGACGIRAVRRFPVEPLAVRIGGEMEDPAGPWPEGLRGAAHLDDCLAQALSASALPRGARVAVIVATTKGFLDAGRGTAVGDPSHDIGTPARWVAGRLRERFGLDVAPIGSGFRPMTISTACASGTAALAVAAARTPAMSAAGLDAVVVAGVDLLSDFVFRGFAALAAMDPNPCRPFDTHRAGMSASEAAAVIVLEPSARARARGARVLGWITGWGLANDAAHATAPSRDGSGMAHAIGDALGRAGLDASELGHVHAHGTATVFNDAMEVRALTSALGEASRDVVVTTLKGTIGHAFGVAGLVETIASLEAVSRGVIPAIRGLVTPEPGLRLATSPVSLASPRFLKIGAGFGGFDAAVVVEGVRSATEGRRV